MTGLRDKSFRNCCHAPFIAGYREVTACHSLKRQTGDGKSYPRRTLRSVATPDFLPRGLIFRRHRERVHEVIEQNL